MKSLLMPVLPYVDYPIASASQQARVPLLEAPTPLIQQGLAARDRVQNRYKC